MEWRVVPQWPATWSFPPLTGEGVAMTTTIRCPTAAGLCSFDAELRRLPLNDPVVETATEPAESIISDGQAAKGERLLDSQQS